MSSSFGCSQRGDVVLCFLVVVVNLVNVKSGRKLKAAIFRDKRAFRPIRSAEMVTALMSYVAYFRPTVFFDLYFFL